VPQGNDAANLLKGVNRSVNIVAPFRREVLMRDDEYREYLRRANSATSVRELRALADHVNAAHPDDVDAELIDATCFAYATAIIERLPERAALERKRAAAGRSSIVPARAMGREVLFRPVADKPKRSRID
jgi:hypothetical protein